LSFFPEVVFDFVFTEGLAAELELAFFLEWSSSADDSAGRLLFEVVLLGAFSFAHSVLHDFLLFVHFADEF
jgi:hypothetical protein